MRNDAARGRGGCQKGSLHWIAVLFLGSTGAKGDEAVRERLALGVRWVLE